MNILVNPILHPLLQLFISILLILGTIQIGSNINSYFTKSKNFFKFNPKLVFKFLSWYNFVISNCICINNIDET